MDLQKALAWAVVVVAVVFLVWQGIADARKDRAQRRSTVAGKDIVYRGSGHSRLGGVWKGLILLWLGGNAAVSLLFVRYAPERWQVPVAAGTAIVAGILLLLAVLSFADQVRTEHVEGRVVQRRITYSGEDGQTRHHWIAVDDSRGATRIRGIAVSHAEYRRVVAGSTVRLHVTPRARRVKAIEVLAHPAAANEFPGEHAALFPHGVADLKVGPDRAAAFLGGPVEVVAVAVAVPGARRYVYVPVGTRLFGDSPGGPHLQVTEADTPDAAAGVDRLAAQRGGKQPRWRPGERGVIDYGSVAYVMSWGAGVLAVAGRSDPDTSVGVRNLAHTLKPPRS
ncbi:hypothetical protein ACFQZ4_03145 [Catellatospora coxensis]|uniref:hypothetical protein n=1 Tax=Catellatospora coxensis TaxID=310354 RepID=UPI0019423099|nr:hypothetical protein [Catellatospora coxensis]